MRARRTAHELEVSLHVLTHRRLVYEDLNSTNGTRDADCTSGAFLLPYGAGRSLAVCAVSCCMHASFCNGGL